ncbi:MAG TPA: hypothetical protein PLR76_05680 [Hyphomonas sp.]|nr:hypothetical protein [Hyphomonas sp.]HPE47863.1 hypothetical protein [Hyphomonas sp.]
MEVTNKIAWALLALLHVTPALSAFAPGLVERLYGVSPDGDIGVLLVHRGALFLAVCIAALYAMVDPGSRRLASLILFVSMVGFLLVYVRAGLPAGELRKIAIADLIGLIPLTWVTVNVWR